MYSLSGYPEAGPGIFYIRGYLERLCEENRLCGGFDRAAIVQKLNQQARPYGIDSDDLVVNLYETLHQ